MKLVESASTNLITLTTKIDDLELDMVMNTSTFFMFTLTPEYHSHPCYEMIAAVSGSFRVESLTGEVIEMHPGSVCIIPPDCFHATNSDLPDHEMVVMRFSYKRAAGAPEMFERFDSALKAVTSAARFDDCSRVTDLMLEIRDELFGGSISPRTVASTLMPTLYITLLRRISSVNSAPHKLTADCEDNKQSRYFRIDRWLSEHHTQPVTADDLAQALNLSKRQLSRVLRDIYDMSFRDLLVEYRLYRAIKFLTRSDCSIDKIAALVGYSSPTGFRRAFIKRFGVTAGEYRRKHAFKDSKPNLY